VVDGRLMTDRDEPRSPSVRRTKYPPVVDPTNGPEDPFNQGLVNLKHNFGVLIYVVVLALVVFGASAFALWWTAR
jgi:hypothetical protein